MVKIKLDKTAIFILLLGVLVLASLGFTIKESFESQIDVKDVDSTGNRINTTMKQGSNYDPFSSAAIQSALPKGIAKSQIANGQEDLYILKSEVVPPVCPKCPDVRNCPRPKPCPACPSCARCPEPAFECKKVPNYSSTNSRLPRPFLNDFSQFT